MAATAPRVRPRPAPHVDTRLIAGAAVRLALFPVVLLAPAGTWRWPEAWALTAIYATYGVAMSLWLHARDPELLAERSKLSPVQAGQMTWDKAISIGLFAVGLVMFVTPGLDRRWAWTDVPVSVEVAALALHVPALVWIAWVMKENTFLSRVVKIDVDRGHRVATTGPYAYVRHPMYSAVLVLLLAFPLALGSLAAFVPAIAMVALLVARTALEDAALHDELDGYRAYAKTTRHRLIPWIW